MATGKSFHLHWNNHLTNLRTLLEYLYNEQSFVDVTLSCSDGFIRAHKLVLSACSPYFDTIFRENPCKHPTVILRGISLREMQLIIEYMYVGSVDIPENELSGLLEIANELHIKGLVQDPADNEEKQPPSSSPSRLELENQKIHDSCVSEDDSKEREALVTTNESDSISHLNNLAQLWVKIEDNREDIDEKANSDKYQFDFSQTSSNMPPDPELFCNICNRGFLNKQNMKRHMQTHSGVKPHQCQFCSLSFLRLSHLQRHHRVHTGERPFLCDQCDKQFSRSDKLKQHVALHHSAVGLPKQVKQRGRPRKVFNPQLNINSSCNSKHIAENIETATEMPSLQTLQQFYSNTSNNSGIPVMQ